MITVAWQGQFANQMFEYCFGRALAKHHGLALACPAHFSSKRKRVQRCIWDELFIPQPVDGKVLPGKLSGDYIWADATHDTFVEDCWQFFKQEPERWFVMGYWQLSQLYEPHREAIRNDWLPMLGDKFEPKEQIAVHVRLGDFKHDKRISAAEYIKAINKLPSDLPIVLLSDAQRIVHEPDLRGILNEYGDRIEFYHQNHMNDFRMIASSSHVVFNLLSTYPWWATFYGDPKQVVAIHHPRHNHRRKEQLRMTFTDFIIHETGT